jgi:hypothetical protein
MVNFNKTFKEIAKMEFTHYGFKCKGNNFVRVVDDVMQNFNLNLSRSGWSCTVDFGIVPLCYPIEKRNITEGLGAYMLRMFEDNMQWWEFDRKSEISIVNCINELVEYIHKYIIPFFERGRNCSNAYHEICSFEKSKSRPFNNSVKMDDYLKYCMALKIGNYYAALLHLRAIEQQWVDAYNEMNERGYMTKEYEEKTKRGLEKFRKEIEMVANQDEQAIRDFIHNNEAYSISNLKGVYKK